MKNALKSRFAVPLLLASLAVALLPVSAVGKTPVPAVKRLPREVYAYISVPNVTALKQRWDKTQMAAMTRDKAFAEFRKDIENQLKQLSGQAEKESGFKLEDLLNIPSGEITAVLMKGSKQVPAAVLFLDFGKNRSLVQKLATAAEKSLKAAGMTRSVREIANTKVVVFTPAANNNVEEGTLSQLEYSYFLKETQLVISTDPAAMKSVLERWDGTHKETFADVATFRYIRNRCRTDGRAPLLEWYVNPLELMQAVLLGIEETPAAAKQAAAFLPLLGLNKFKAVGGAVDMATKEYESVTKFVVYVDLPLGGLLETFRFPAIPMTPPKWIPAKASSYSGFNWDVPNAYSSVESLFNTFSVLQGGPTLDKVLDKLAQDPNGPGIHLKKDVVDQLTGRFHVLADFIDQQDASTAYMITGIGVKDEKKVKAVLAKLAKHPDFPGKERQYKNQPLYELEFGAALGQNLGTIVIAVRHKHLMISTSVEAMEQMLSGKLPEKSLAESSDYRKIAAKFPQAMSIMSFQKSDTNINTIYNQFRSGIIPVNIPGIDFTKLPPFAKLQKYLPLSGGYTVPDKHGVYSVGFSLKKK
ncbi:MAG: hypothetical protein IID45_03030 [Planctomycetes bacterium]|nr:hypothetical protein [Planctomycetota bacterium]